MRSRDFLSVIAVLVAASATTACSSKVDNSQSMAPQGNDSFSARNSESPPAPLTPSTAHLTSATGDAPAAAAAVENSQPPQGSGVPVTSSSKTTTATTRRNYPQNASSYTSQTVSQSTAAPANGQYGYAPVNGAANQSTVPYNDAQSYGAAPAANAQYPGGGYANTEGYGDGDRHVRVNAPLVHVNVDRDNGGVHIDLPFVHINKPSRYESSQVSIPDRNSAAVSQNGY
jgi:hypothetical protein